MEYFEHFVDGLTPWSISLLTLLAAALLFQLIYYWYYLHTIVRINKREAKGKLHYETEQPPVSVIVCARNESENLAQFLPLVLEQDYPNYEVIVVNDGSSDESELVLEGLKQKYPHLYVTFVPEEVRIISRKKLALTIGVKAAKHDILLFTDADCRPASGEWIARMARHFASKTEFVIGHGGYSREKGFLNKLISYDTLYIAMQYLSFAFHGHPYMGVGRNMAYRKETFYRLNGFASSLHIPSGDDDLIINHSANKTNIGVEATAAGSTVSVPKLSFRDWFYQKKRHLATGKSYTGCSKRMLLWEPLTRLLFYVAFIVTMCSDDIYIMGLGFLAFIVRWINQIIVIDCAAAKLNERKFYLLIPVFDVILPLITLGLMYIPGPKRKTNHTDWR